MDRGLEMPLSGHPRVPLIIRFTFDGSIEFEHGVDADFPDALRDRGLLGAQATSHWYSWLRSWPSMAT